MEDDLKKRWNTPLQKMEDDIKRNGRRTQKKWKTTSKKMEDNLKKSGRQPQKNEILPQVQLKKSNLNWL